MGSLGWLWGAVGGFLAPLGRPWAGSWDLLGPSWASLGWSGPHLGWILGPRDSLGLDFRGSGDVPGRVLVCFGVAFYHGSSWLFALCRVLRGSLPAFLVLAGLPFSFLAAPDCLH